MHAHGSGEAARRAKRGRQPEKKKVPLPSRAISHARGHLRVLRFARRTTEKRETARSLTRSRLSKFTGDSLIIGARDYYPKVILLFAL